MNRLSPVNVGAPDSLRLSTTLSPEGLTPEFLKVARLVRRHHEDGMNMVVVDAHSPVSRSLFDICVSAGLVKPKDPRDSIEVVAIHDTKPPDAEFQFGDLLGLATDSLISRWRDPEDQNWTLHTHADVVVFPTAAMAEDVAMGAIGRYASLRITGG